MSIQVRPLLGPYALAAGEMVLARVKAFGELPPLLQESYATWLAHQQTLTLLPDGPRVRFLDPFLDRALLLPAYLCQEIINTYADVPVPLSDSQRQRLEDARALVTLFGDDLRVLVNIPFVEEWAAARDILRRLSEDKGLADATKRLGLTDDVALCASLHEAYGKALGISLDVNKNSLERKVAEWNDSFRELLIGASFLERTVPGLYALFSEPHAEQLRKQQETLARQRSSRVEAPSGGGLPANPTPSPGGATAPGQPGQGGG
jgi:hypothetical protein